MIFKNRHEAGQKLAEALKKFKNKKDVIVLGIPRGGVEVAFNIAKTLKVPLSIVVTKKIGHPFEPEFAIGAVSPGGHYSINKEYQAEAGEEYIKNTVREMNSEIKRRYKEYATGKLPELKNKIAIIVDDGLATGYTMLAAIKYAKSKNPKKVIVAIPVAAQDSFEKVKAIVDEVVCLHTPLFFGAVGSFYQEFTQLEDEEVKFYLKESRKIISSQSQ
jgi:predicted phosphoribosyltransferase|tara:strand:- start:25067 stop:25717 length:651 start_codon:yes stop_codon:yes gene_type:complete